MKTLFLRKILFLTAITAPPALASPAFWQLSNVTFAGGIIATGSFAFDSATSAMSNVSVTVTGPSVGFFNFFVSGPVAFNTVSSVFNSFSSPNEFALVLLPPGGSAAGDLVLIAFAGLNSAAPATTALRTGSSGLVSSLQINGTPSNDIQSSLSGSLVPQSTAPEPATSGLFAISLGLSWFVCKARKGGSQDVDDISS